MSKQKVYEEVLNLIMFQDNDLVQKLNFKDLDLKNFNEEQLELLKDFYPSSIKLINDELEKIKLSKLNPENFYVKVRKMNLRQLNEEINKRKDLINLIDDKIIFDDTITDDLEKDYWEADKELNYLEKQIKLLLKGE